MTLGVPKDGRPTSRGFTFHHKLCRHSTDSKHKHQHKCSRRQPSASRKTNEDTRRKRRAVATDPDLPQRRQDASMPCPCADLWWRANCRQLIHVFFYPPTIQQNRIQPSVSQFQSSILKAAVTQFLKLLEASVLLNLLVWGLRSVRFPFTSSKNFNQLKIYSILCFGIKQLNPKDKIFNSANDFKILGLFCKPSYFHR